ncbi:MAG: GNAT family protein [Planctomycetota bacterium]
MTDIAVNADVALTEYRPSDRDRVVAIANDRDVAGPLIAMPHPYEPRHFDEWIELVTRNTERHGRTSNFAIRQGDDVIGGFSLKDPVHGHKTEIGYWLGQPYWGRGIMTAVVTAGCRHAIDHWGVVRVTATTFATNHASARVLEKNGFAREGLMRKYHRKRGHYLDAVLYALIREYSPAC